MDAKTISDALGGKKCGNGYIMGCVAHDDRSPSLSVTDGRNGNPVVYCHSGCDFTDVTSELRARGLWTEFNVSPSEVARYKSKEIIVKNFRSLEHEVLVLSQFLNLRLYEPDKEMARVRLLQGGDRENLAVQKIIKLLGEIYG